MIIFLSCVCSICALSSIAIVLSPAFAHLVIILFFVIVSLLVLEPNYIVCVKYFFRIADKPRNRGSTSHALGTYYGLAPVGPCT